MMATEAPSCAAMHLTGIRLGKLDVQICMRHAQEEQEIYLVAAVGGSLPHDLLDSALPWHTLHLLWSSNCHSALGSNLETAHL